MISSGRGCELEERSVRPEKRGESEVIPGVAHPLFVFGIRWPAVPARLSGQVGLRQESLRCYRVELLLPPLQQHFVFDARSRD